MNASRNTLLLAASALANVAMAQQASNPPPAVQHTPPERTYEISVTSADGATFRDCATFGEDYSLVLLEANGLVIDWLYESTDPSGRNFHAVSNGSRMSSNPIGLAVHGTFAGSDAIRGDAINALGLTFTFKGRLNRGCSPTAYMPPERSPYAAAPGIPVLFEPGPGSVAGKMYAVSLYGADVDEDCLIFAINGTVSSSSGVTMEWGMDRANERLGTFQAVGPHASAGSGRALRGELSTLGELRVHGIESDARGRREIVGSGRQTASCIN
jgi:hypothetical protein